ncbi:MAG: hypothetical protein AAFY34_10290 [Pseudomonadota bacterium]
MSDSNPNDVTDQVDPIAKGLFGWVEMKSAGQLIFWGLAALSVFLIAADFAIDRHYKEEIEGITGFYAIYGFLSFGFVVLMGWPLGRLLRRKENFYGDEPAEEGDQ